MRWRGWLAFAGLGCAGAFAYRGGWLAACGVAVCVLVPVILRFRRDMATTRATMRILAEMSAMADGYARVKR